MAALVHPGNILQDFLLPGDSLLEKNPGNLIVHQDRGLILLFNVKGGTHQNRVEQKSDKFTFSVTATEPIMQLACVDKNPVSAFQTNDLTIYVIFHPAGDYSNELDIIMPVDWGCKVWIR